MEKNQNGDELEKRRRELFLWGSYPNTPEELRRKVVTEKEVTNASRVIEVAMRCMEEDEKLKDLINNAQKLSAGASLTSHRKLHLSARRAAVNLLKKVRKELNV